MASRRMRGLIVLLMMMSLLAGCGPSNQMMRVPKYNAAKTEAIITDEKTCGPAAKEALYDYEAVLAGQK